MSVTFSFQQWWPTPLPWQVCPKCGAGVDRTQVKIVEQRPPEVERRLNHAAFHPNDDGGTYTATYTCASCATPSAAAGEWGFDLDFEESDKGVPYEVWRRTYAPRWVSHFPELVVPPSGAPRAIVEALRRAKPLFWVDRNACATALRQSVEVFLDEQGVKRFRPKADGTQGSFRSLEVRIEEFVTAVEKVSSEAADEYESLLRATKFKGNDATHDAERLDAQDLRTLARLIDRVLVMRYPEADGLLSEAAEIVGNRFSNRQRRRSGSSAAEADRTSPGSPGSPPIATAGEDPG